MAAMNSYAESTANALRRQQYVPTSETLLAYVKTLTRDEILANVEAQVDVVEAVDKKGWQYFLATNLPYSPKRVLKLYKRRWGIETSYRKI
jgi:IS4 transposase